MLRKAFIIAALAVLFVSSVQAAGPTLVGKNNQLLWTVPTVPAPDTIASYTLFISTTSGGETGAAAVVKNVGLTTTPTAPAVVMSSLGLADGTYYVEVQATDAVGNVSALSNEVPIAQFTVPPPAPTLSVK